MNDRKKQANAYVAAHSSQMTLTYRPGFHMASPCGWINDPNGFCVYKGRYHLFYQYAPQTTDRGGRMYWGHSVSDDLLHWAYLGVALAPDTGADSEQCWSGNAVENEHGQLVLMYTGLRPDADGRVLQVQNIAVSEDGITFVKPDANPVLSGKDLPPDGSPYDFRDPKPYWENGKWYVLVANKNEHTGHMLRFSSKDLVHWQHEGIYLRNLGDMPECPDIFQLDGQRVMITSALGIPPDGYRFRNLNTEVLYLLGHESAGEFHPDQIASIDMGPDFYAPQSILTADGRRVMIGWMQNWHEDSPTHYLHHGWNGSMTIPRELTLKEGMLYQLPVKELATLHGRYNRWENIDINGTYELPGFDMRRYDLEISLTVPEGEKIEMQLLKTGYEYFSLRYDAESRLLSTDRARCGYSMGLNGEPEQHTGGRGVVPGTGDMLKLRILVDTNSVEVFAQDGALAITTLCFPKEKAVGITFAGNATIHELDCWEMKAIFPTVQ